VKFTGEQRLRADVHRRIAPEGGRSPGEQGCEAHQRDGWFWRKVGRKLHRDDAPAGHDQGKRWPRLRSVLKELSSAPAEARPSISASEAPDAKIKSGKAEASASPIPDEDRVSDEGITRRGRALGDQYPFGNRVLTRSTLTAYNA
jgi:hypothetical protein